MTGKIPAPKVCVIEDDAALRSMLEATLTRGGYEVSLAKHGLDALMQIDRAQPKPHLLIVDIMLPEIDGLTLVRALKKKPETKNIPVIFLTAKTDAKTIAEGISVGAKFYLTKPFAVDDLLTKVRRALGG
ncbi:MAG TPA: response regulator transcription factor [Haliangiales bacterium]|nr:response regulator transcription factor [Haliangiales bacterium]